jgi:hypothetical protein
VSAIGATTESRGPAVRVFRGLCGGIVGGAGAVAIVAVLWLSFLSVRWLVEDATQWQREHDLRATREELVFSVLGCATVAACAGWATYAPAGRYRFARSLVIVFLASVLLWVLIAVLNPAPRRYKGEHQPDIGPTQVTNLIGSPIIVSAILTFVRVRRANRDRA